MYYSVTEHTGPDWTEHNTLVKFSFNTVFLPLVESERVREFSSTGGQCHCCHLALSLGRLSHSLTCWQDKNKVDTKISSPVSQAKIPTNRSLFVVKLSTKQTTLEERKSLMYYKDNAEWGANNNNTVRAVLLHWGITLVEKRKRLFIMLSSSTPVIWLIVCTG